MVDISYDRIADDLELLNGDLKFTSDVDSSGAAAASANALNLAPVTEQGTVEGIRQNLISYLLTFSGEYFLSQNDNGYGVPWVQEIFRPKPLEVARATRVIRNAILTVDGVATLEELRLIPQKSSRILQVEFVARTDSGALIEDNVLVGG